MSVDDHSPDFRRSRPSPGRTRSTGPGLWPAVRERAAWRDLALLAVVPGVLLVVYSLPRATKWTLALDYAEPTLLAAYGSHFVHFSQWHLLVNLLGYLLVATTGYVLSLAGGRRRQFLVVFTAFVLAFPVALSGLTLPVPGAGAAVGFSGVVMAFVGYLPVVLLDFADHRLDAPVDRRRSHWLFFLGLAVVAYVAAPGLYGPALAAAALLACLLFFLPVFERFDRGQWAEFRGTLASGGNAELTVFGAAVFLAYPFVAFPPDVTVGGGVLNVYAHALGFSLGYIVTYVTVLVGGLNVD